MKTVLVTGGAGFIGSALVRMLASDSSIRIVNVDSLTYAGNLESLPGIAEGPRYLFCRTDICDHLAFRAILARNKPDAIIHCAAESHVDRSIDCPAQFITTNVFGTFTLLQESLDYWRSLEPSARRNFRFVHVSTDEVFGSLGDTGHFTEATAYSPNSPYSASKASSDHLVRAWHRTYGFPSVTTNCSNNYGPYQFPEKLIPLMVLRALAGKELPVYGQGVNVRDWLYVDDHCRALLAVLNHGKPGETYNIGGSNEIRNIDVVEAICRVVDEISPSTNIPDRKSLITFVHDRPGHDFRYAIDASKIGRELGWKALETFQSGLQKTVEWYVANQTWTERVQSGAYRGERLGLAAVR